MNERLTKLLKAKALKKRIKDILSEEVENNLDCYNLYKCFDLQAKLINLQIFAGDKTILINENLIGEIEKDFENAVVSTILKLYKPKNKEDFLNILCENYFENGFLCHGTRKVHFKNIKKNGLNGNNNFRNIELLTKINNIFLKHNRKKCFEGKMHLLSLPSYYSSDNFYSGIYYAYQSPEYFSRFCANGHITRGNEYNTFAYFAKNKKECYKNIKIFCDLHDFSKDEKKDVLTCFDILWKQNVSRFEKYFLCLIPREKLQLDENEIVLKLKNNIKSYSKKEIVKILLQPRYIHNNTFIPVKFKDLTVIQLLPLYKNFKVSNRGKKFVKIKDKKIIFDLMLDKPYIKKRFYVFNSDCDKNLDNVVFVSKDNFEKFILKNKDLISNELKANSEIGERVINIAREKNDFQNYKKRLIKKVECKLKACKQALNNNLESCLKKLYELLFEDAIILKTSVDNNNWFSNLDTGAYYTAYGNFDQGYEILKAKSSNVYDKNLLKSRINNIDNYIKKIKN